MRAESRRKSWIYTTSKGGDKNRGKMRRKGRRKKEERGGKKREEKKRKERKRRRKRGRKGRLKGLVEGNRSIFLIFTLTDNRRLTVTL